MSAASSSTLAGSGGRWFHTRPLKIVSHRRLATQSCRLAATNPIDQQIDLTASTRYSQNAGDRVTSNSNTSSDGTGLLGGSEKKISERRDPDPQKHFGFLGKNLVFAGTCSVDFYVRTAICGRRAKSLRRRYARAHRYIHRTFDFAKSRFGGRTCTTTMKIPTRATDSAMLSPAIHDWNDPDWSVLDDRRGDLPDFPTDVLTLPWQNWLWRASRGAGVRPEHVAVPLIGVASSLIGTARRVRASRSWSEPMTLWTCVVAASGDRKTPGLNVTLRALDRIEQHTSDAINVARLAHETRRQNAKEAAKEWKVQRKAALDAEPRREPPAMPIEAIDPGNFIYPRLYASDPTIESLAPLLVARPRGMMLIRDELSGFFANMGRYGGVIGHSGSKPGTATVTSSSAYRKDHSTSRTSSSALSAVSSLTSSLARSKVTRTGCMDASCSLGHRRRSTAR